MDIMLPQTYCCIFPIYISALAIKSNDLIQADMSHGSDAFFNRCQRLPYCSSSQKKDILSNHESTMIMISTEKQLIP